MILKLFYTPLILGIHILVLWDKTFTLWFEPELSQVFAVTLTSEAMHLALGPPSSAVINKLTYSDIPKIAEYSSRVAWKTTQVYAKKKLFKDGAPLQLTHADLCGPFLVRGLTTEKYYLTIMDDDFSKWFQAIPLNAK